MLSTDESSGISNLTDCDDTFLLERSYTDAEAVYPVKA